MSNPYLGEIKLVPYTFAPQGWAFCAGQLLAIDQFSNLFNLIGTTYGGDGQSTFALPDLQGRVAVHNGPGFVEGQKAGEETVTLSTAQIPAHTHQVNAGSAIGTLTTPIGNHLDTSPLSLGFAYGATPSGKMAPGTIQPAGGSQPHSNIQPYLVLNYIISLVGNFPSR